MSNTEKKLDAMMRFVTAETDEDRKQAQADLRELARSNPAPKATVAKSMETIIAAILVDIGAPCHIKGHNYLISAIEAAVHNPDIINAITGELYPKVAEAHDTTPSRVERAIRHAIEVAWDRGDIENLQSYFGNTISNVKGKPTNAEFIARVAQVIRMRMDGEA
ncbi:MAG: sporulation initiation factor Spo0A C-terminal domain-containing protein [Oscillospiraceae bacterium]|nr:sporulation initiation factor Spo0A C-terminal domain-containing protein [Oscillospiraceae bacterium]